MNGWAALTLALASLLCLAAVLAWRYRNYPAELRAVVNQIRTEMPAIDSSSERDKLGPYYIVRAAAAAPHITEAEDSWFNSAWKPPISYGVKDHAVSIAQLALEDHSRWLASGDDRLLARACCAADELVRLQGSDGAWRYSFDFKDLKAGWVSGMAQGQVISLLTRVYQATHCEQYLEAAVRGYTFMITQVSAGGTLGVFADDSPIFEEYPNSIHAHAMNGNIFAILGVRDLALVTGEESAERLWRDAANAQASQLNAYDTGSWTLYDNDTDGRMHLAFARYHALHIAQARVMYALTGDERWADAAKRWWGYYEPLRQSSLAGIMWWDMRYRLSVVFGKAR